MERRLSTPPLPEEEAMDLSRLTEIVIEMRDSLLAMNFQLQQLSAAEQHQKLLQPPPTGFDASDSEPSK